MKNEKLYIYFYPNEQEEATKLLERIKSLGLSAEFINLDQQPDDTKLVSGLVEKSVDPFPVLRVGELKIRAVFNNPQLELLEKIFAIDSKNQLNLPQPTIYSTTWCGDCKQLKFWMDSQKLTNKEILIEDSEELKDQIYRWSGGRRVIPTISYESIGRLFNPGIAFFQKLYL